MLSELCRKHSTYFEAAACARARARNIAGGTMTQAALAIAQLCYEILLRDRYKAKVACERRVVTEALPNIVEVNTKRRGCLGATIHPYALTA
ncbi:hypothetical protein P4S95_16450 [Aneurinibacillus aneurinilyticus]|uniref:hypothetical protein n=1 Tax=Aneurinibacillus aneurinilyticus TaxID=1391 RepID=UPI002E1FC067|nr:hypothetical protein [Aneurinibacillus aneurinilyticus]